MKQLADKGQFEKLRFWGKILGTQKNYYVAEAEQNPDDEGEDEDENEEANENDEDKDNDDDDGEEDEDPLPKSTYKPPAMAPKEERGIGVNKFTYYVCNARKSLAPHPRPSTKVTLALAGSPWTRLPTVTPAQIAQARQIKVFFTGDLTRAVHSCPAYPGTEKNYLRAQIARISATTQVSPAGKFKFSEVMLPATHRSMTLLLVGRRRNGRRRWTRELPGQRRFQRHVPLRIDRRGTQRMGNYRPPFLGYRSIPSLT